MDKKEKIVYDLMKSCVRKNCGTCDNCHSCACYCRCNDEEVDTYQTYSSGTMTHVGVSRTESISNSIETEKSVSGVSVSGTSINESISNKNANKADKSKIISYANTGKETNEMTISKTEISDTPNKSETTTIDSVSSNQSEEGKVSKSSIDTISKDSTLSKRSRSEERYNRRSESFDTETKGKEKQKTIYYFLAGSVDRDIIEIMDRFAEETYDDRKKPLIILRSDINDVKIANEDVFISELSDIYSSHSNFSKCNPCDGITIYGSGKTVSKLTINQKVVNCRRKKHKDCDEWGSVWIWILLGLFILALIIILCRRD